MKKEQLPGGICSFGVFRQCCLAFIFESVHNKKQIIMYEGVLTTDKWNKERNVYGSVQRA